MLSCDYISSSRVNGCVEFKINNLKFTAVRSGFSGAKFYREAINMPVKQRSIFAECLTLLKDINYDKKLALQTKQAGYFTPERVIAANKLWQYISSCKWCQSKRARDLVNVARMSDSQAATVLSISPSTVRSLRSYASRKIYSIIGKDCIAVIRNGNSNDLFKLCCKLHYHLYGYETASNWIPERVMEMFLKNGRTSTQVYNLSQCLRELEFIARYDLVRMSLKCSRVNPDKLTFLLEILSGTSTKGSGYTKEDVVNLIFRLQNKHFGKK